MPDRVRRLAAALVAVAALAATSCSSVPTSGEPQRIGDVESPPVLEDLWDKADVREIPEKPALDAQPAEIVLGFLNAQADSADGRAIARLYLLRPDLWAEGGNTTIYSGVQLTEIEEGDDRAVRRVRAAYQVVARISTDGEYTPDVRAVVHNYELRGSQGQWRLTGVPSGLWISANAVSQAFRRAVPYYVAPDGQRLVPDPVYLSKAPGHTLAMLVQRVIDGPGPWLRRSGVTTRFPKGTKLRAARLVDDGVLELEFSDEINAAEVADRRALVAQLVWTLTSQLAVDSLRILAGGDPFVVDADTDVNTIQRRDRWSSYGPDEGETERPLYYNRGGRLVAFRPPLKIQRIGGRRLPVGAQPAVDRTGSRFAVLRDGGPAGTSELLMGAMRQGALAVRARGRQMSNPSWGSGADGVWVVRHNNKGRPEVLTVPAATGQPTSVGTVDSGRHRVVAFEVARDGTRFATILDVDGDRRLYVGLIRRERDGGQRPVSVGSLRPIAPGLDVSAVTWGDSGRLVLIGSEGTADPAVWSVAVDGSELVQLSDSRGVLARGRDYQLLARPDRVAVVVNNDVLFDNIGSRWLSVPRRDPGS